MLKTQFTKRWANCLAILMIWTSMGISINTLLCHCTKSNYWSILTPLLIECCEHNKKSKDSCCKQTTLQQANTSCTKATQKKCCDSKFDYKAFKAENNEQKLFVVDNIVQPPLCYGYLSYPAEAIAYPSTLHLAVPSNKAPPFDSRGTYRHFIQIYRC